MILKIKVGSGARGLLSYLSQTSKTAHDHTRPFFTNMAGTNPRELASEVSALRRLKPNLKKAVAHLSLSSDPKDRALTHEEWRQAITIALAAQGAQDAAFAAYQHHDTNHPHTHVFFCVFKVTARSSVTHTVFAKTRRRPARLKRSLT
jgi:hypothetical protein